MRSFRRVRDDNSRENGCDSHGIARKIPHVLALSRGPFHPGWHMGSLSDPRSDRWSCMTECGAGQRVSNLISCGIQ